MTPATLRTLMARAFAEECRKYYVGSGDDGVCVLDNEGNQIGPLFDYSPDAVAFINERGIVAAMRAAAENIGRSDYARNLSWGELVAIGLFLSDTGDIT